MKLLKNLFFKSTRVVPYSWINTVAEAKLLLPYHHVVSDHHLPHIKNLYHYKNIQQFSADLEWLLKHRIPISPDEAAKALIEKKPLKKNAFLLSFDDGFRELYDVVAPLLLKKGVPAIFFINPSFIDNRELFFRSKISLVLEKLKEKKNNSLNSKIADYLLTTSSEWHHLRSAMLKIHYNQKEKVDILGEMADISFAEYLSANTPFLSVGQLKELHSKGFAIGAHSMDHPHYGTITENEQLEQTLNSIKHVQAVAPSSYSFFSFPHEDRIVKQSFFDRLLADQTLPVKILFGTQNQKSEERNQMLHRFNAEDPATPLSEVVKAQLIFGFLKKKLNQHTVQRN